MSAANLRIIREEPEGSGSCRATLPFVHGPAAPVTIRFELAGDEQAPLLILAGGISADAHVIASDDDPSAGWWEAQADVLGRFRRLAIDWVGADGSLDRPIHPADQARAILLAMDHLGIDSAAAFIGASYGGMTGMHLAALAPDRCGRLLAISAAHRAHPFVSAQRALQRQAVELGERLGDPRAGVALARKMAMTAYRTPEEFADRFAASPCLTGERVTCGAEPYLDAQGTRHSARVCTVAYRRLSESIDLHAIEPERITVPALFAAALDDCLIPRADIAELAERAPRGRFAALPTRFGHDSFLKEHALVASLLSDFLENLEYDHD
ncbi:homoserine O-succinyltransferase MetX [Sphingomonas glaciei]|uniref:Homoserine O-succinyltransferase n=1 Tax=Sphingomonas glaciei TaxID=2938948 RepID=A0ABY5MZ57_9SPHN|nr:homoserine O-succinyltransferase [Sphingomonas glaciei]UUR08358.1 homoserine O-succinyltransferase [Sphingomonas glaciei]